MSCSIQITSQARIDIQHAIDWEDNRQRGLGLRFWKELDQKFDVISHVPELGSLKIENIRCTTTKIFHYVIYYTVDDNTESVIILRVLHIRRKPLF